MAKKVRSITQNRNADIQEAKARSGVIFSRGIRTDRDYLEACVAVADDLANARFSASVGNAIGVNTRNMLKMLELKFKYGVGSEGAKRLQITG